MGGTPEPGWNAGRAGAPAPRGDGESASSAARCWMRPWRASWGTVLRRGGLGSGGGSGPPTFAGGLPDRLAGLKLEELPLQGTRQLGWLGF